MSNCSIRHTQNNHKWPAPILKFSWAFELFLLGLSCVANTVRLQGFPSTPQVCQAKRKQEFHRRGNAPLGVPCCPLPDFHSLCPCLRFQLCSIPCTPETWGQMSLPRQVESQWTVSHDKENMIRKSFCVNCVALTTGALTFSLLPLPGCSI